MPPTSSPPPLCGCCPSKGAPLPFSLPVSILHMLPCAALHVNVLRVRLFSTPWTVACQPPLSMGFSRQEYWSELPLPTQGDLPDPGIKPSSLASPTLAGGFFTASSPGKSPYALSTASLKSPQMTRSAAAPTPATDQVLASLTYSRVYHQPNYKHLIYPD